MNAGQRNQIESILKKTDETLEDAVILFDQGRFSAAASRAYYAVFHALQAVLLTKELTFSKHSGVIGGFSRYFIKEGFFPKEFALKIKNLWKNREIGDYEYEKKISEEEAHKCLDDSKLIVTELENYLKKLD
ncbi:HEPN domain-containing protein [Candidatus Margulisiibacteriota bacterium]